MHLYIWVYWDQLDANCLVLFYYTFFTLHVSDVIYIKSSGASYNAHALTCIRLHVHYMTLLRMDVYYIQNM